MSAVGRAEVFAENLRWIERDRAEHTSIVRGVLSELVSKDMCGALPRDAARVFRDAVGEINTPERVRVFTELCAALHCGVSSDVGASAKSKIDELLCPSDGELVVYVRSDTADAAFETFSDGREVRASYAASFREACESVYYERADYCILPLEDTSDGLLVPFRRMMMKYDLRLCGAVLQRNGEDTASVLALVGGSAALSGDVYEYYVPSVSAADIVCISAMCEALGARLVRITSVMSEYGGEFDHHVCIRVDRCDCGVLEYTVEALYPASQLLGRYSIREA